MERVLATETLTKNPAGSRRVYRRRAMNACCSLCMVGVGVAFTTGVIDWTPDGKGIIGTAVVVVLAGGTAAFGWYLAFRTAIQGVLVDGSGVLIRNALRSHRIEWQEVDHFEYGRCDPWPRIGVTVLRSGRRIGMVSLQRGYVGHWPARAVAELNHRLEEHNTAVSRA
jgi:hypothetical protein